ncbi:phage virion morphogenesis protein [Solidesulfovibrio carbinoliphilus subsp. oakridgensis]|uniref:Phage virion morphogenesis protein n=1 Tax=Solidesulfovibrio carbinoliphilus subsp. oakridgensis TaxID=694327 RepID=G7QD33_9BACT|nr:phage virion morphogenesis protein [Solidesulfovibrio carbinoliphilus]EHJ46339.1 phage virion morphogenesis protein [Solidesulfovibrio carbinoliphilus subsp. oakridgensis]
MDFRVEVVVAPATGYLAGLLARVNDLTPAMARIGMLLVSSIQENFELGHSPDGQRWKPSRRAMLQGGQTLVDTGALMSGIVSEATANRVEVGPSGPSLKYAAIHQFGGEIRPKSAKALFFRGADGKAVQVKRVRIPARPYLGVGREDINEIGETLLDYLGGSHG